MKEKAVKRKTHARMLPFCALALACQMCAGMDFEVKKGIPYYSPEACTNAYMETLCKLDLRYPKDVTNFATLVKEWLATVSGFCSRTGFIMTVW